MTMNDKLLANVKTLFQMREEISILQTTLEERGLELETQGQLVMTILERAEDEVDSVLIAREIIKMFVSEVTKSYVISK